MSHKVSRQVTVKNHDKGMAGLSKQARGFFRQSFYGGYNEPSKNEPVEESVIQESLEKQKVQDRLRSNKSEAIIFQNNIAKLEQKLYNEGRQKLFTSLMTRAFMESLEFPLDVIEAFMGTIQEMCQAYTVNRYGLLEENHKNNIVLEGMYNVCESHAKKVASNKCKNCKSVHDLPAIKFDMDDDEKKSFLDDAKKIDFGIVANMVKKKVVNVVKDEQERALKRQEYHDKVQQKTSEVEVANESVHYNDDPFFSHICANYRPTQKIDKTLFQALMEQCTTEMMESVFMSSPHHDKYDDCSAPSSYPGMPSQQDTLYSINDRIRKLDEFQGSDDDEDDIENPQLDIRDSDIGDPIDEIDEDCGDDDDCYDNNCGEYRRPIMEDEPCDEDDDSCEEALNIKQRIHKRAKLIKKKLFKKVFKKDIKESVEPNTVDMDEIFLESFMYYTMIELAHTIGLDPMNHNKVRKLIVNHTK